GTHLPVPQRHRDIRQRHARGDGERPRRGRVRLRRGPRACHARRGWPARAVPRRAGVRRQRGAARVRPRAAGTNPARRTPDRPATGLGMRGRTLRTCPDARDRGTADGLSRGDARPDGALTSRADRRARMNDPWTAAIWLVVVASMAAAATVSARWLLKQLATLQARALTPLALRRLARWVKRLDLSDEEFYRAGGAGPRGGGRRRGGRG